MVESDTARSETRARSLLIALIFVGTALNYVDRQVLALLKPTLEAEFNWSDQDFAHLGSVFSLAAAGALIFVGWFVDRFGVRFAYGWAVAVWSLAGMAHAFAASVQQFVVARAVLAVAESVNTPAAVKASAQYLPLSQRSLGLGLVNTAPNIGAILTPLIIPPFALAFGWQAAFLVTGALGFIWLGFWVFGTKRLVPAVTPTKPRAPVAWAAGCLLQAPSRASRRDCEWTEPLARNAAASPDSNSHRCIETSVEHKKHSTRRLCRFAARAATSTAA